VFARTSCTPFRRFGHPLPRVETLDRYRSEIAAETRVAANQRDGNSKTTAR
jgi:hypothetical protein